MTATHAACHVCFRKPSGFRGLTGGFSPELYLAASRVQCLDRGRRNVGGPCCKDDLVSRFMVNSLTRCFVLLTVLTAAAVMPGAGGQKTAPSQPSHPVASHDQTQASIGAGAHIQPLRPGFEFPRQTLRYEAEYRFWTAGVATLRLERNGNQEHLAGTADSSGVVALLFRVQDRFNSYFDAQSLCSYKLTKHTEEGSHWRDTAITFDYSRKQSGTGRKEPENGTIETRRKRHTRMCYGRIVGHDVRRQPPPAAGRYVCVPLNDGCKDGHHPGACGGQRSKSRRRQERFRLFGSVPKATTVC